MLRFYLKALAAVICLRKSDMTLKNKAQKVQEPYYETTTFF